MTGTARDGTTRRIVVGIDSSIGALLALDWAVREAQARSCVVEVVHAWDNVPLPGNMFTSAHELRSASECFVANECAAVARTTDDAPELIPMSVQGPPGRMLVERSVGAEMLVVGRGRHAAVKDLLPGVRRLRPDSGAVSARDQVAQFGGIVHGIASTVVVEVGVHVNAATGPL